MKILNFFNPFTISDKQLYGKALLILCLTICGGIFALNNDYESSKSLTPGLFSFTILYAQLKYSSRQDRKNQEKIAPTK